MATPVALLDIYLNLAGAADEEGKPLQRDKFLVLSAAVAEEGGFAKIANECRLRVLASNPSHLLSHYRDMHAALASADFGDYLKQLARAFPFEKAEYLLEQQRAAGYVGEHGHREIAARARQSTGPTRPYRPAPWPEDSILPRVGDAKAPPAGPRPELSKAFAAQDRFAPGAGAESEPPPALPLSIATLRCWVLLAFGLGLVVGLAASAFVAGLLEGR